MWFCCRTTEDVIHCRLFSFRPYPTSSMRRQCLRLDTTGHRSGVPTATNLRAWSREESSVSLVNKLLFKSLCESYWILLRFFRDITALDRLTEPWLPNVFSEMLRKTRGWNRTSQDPLDESEYLKKQVLVKKNVINTSLTLRLWCLSSMEEQVPSWPRWGHRACSCWDWTTAQKQRTDDGELTKPVSTKTYVQQTILCNITETKTCWDAVLL